MANFPASLPDAPSSNADGTHGEVKDEILQIAKLLATRKPIPVGEWAPFFNLNYANTDTKITAADRAYAAPIWVPETTAYDGLSMRITTSAASSSIEMMQYAADGTDNGPGTHIQTLGNIDSTVTGMRNITGFSATFPAGYSWIVGVTRVGAPRFRLADVFQNACPSSKGTGSGGGPSAYAFEDLSYGAGVKNPWVQFTVRSEPMQVWYRKA